MKTTRGWSRSKNHRDQGDPFSLGGRKSQKPVTLPKLRGERQSDGKNRDTDDLAHNQSFPQRRD
jgi:hypothetical protein